MSALAIFDALDEAVRPTLDPAIHVEPKDRLSASENDRQAEFVATMRKVARACRVYAVPNGAKRSRWEAAKVKREGLAPGEPDVGVSWAAELTARIEFKDGRGDPSDAQIEALNWYHRRCHPVAVCRTAVGAMAWLRSIGAPVPVLS